MSDDLRARANTIAEAANECCGRSDGWQEVIQAVALEQLRAAVKAEREACAKIAEEETLLPGEPAGVARRFIAKHIRARGNP